MILFLFSTYVTWVLRSVVGRFEKKDSGGCFLTPDPPLRVLFRGNFGLRSTQIRPTARLNPLGRRSGISWKRLISVNQDRWWVCVHWETGGSGMLMASETEAPIYRIFTHGEILIEFCLLTFKLPSLKYTFYVVSFHFILSYYIIIKCYFHILF